MRLNITIQIEETDKRRGVHGSVMFAEPATAADVAEALDRNGFDRVTIREGWKRNLYQITPLAGGQHFQFFISDEIATPSAPPTQPTPPAPIASPLNQGAAT